MFVVFPFYDGEAQINAKWLYVEFNFRNSLLCNQNTNNKQGQPKTKQKRHT